MIPGYSGLCIRVNARIRRLNGKSYDTDNYDSKNE